MRTLRHAASTVIAMLLLFAAGRAQAEPASVQLADVIARLDARTSPSLALNAELEDVLRDQPGLVATVPSLLRPGTLRSATTDVLIHALERLGSADAQRALGAILDDSGQAHLDRLRATVALGAVAEPDSKSLETLWQAAGRRSDPKAVDLSNTALLSLGIAGSTLREQAPSKYAPLREELLSRTFGTGDDLERTLLLKAVGNLGDESLGLDVQVFLADDSAPVRASAAQSLGLMRSEGAAPVLAGRLGLEPSGPVRVSIVTSLSCLQAGDLTLKAVHDQLRVEPVPAARAAMVRYLGQHLELIPDARPTLEMLRIGDGARQVRLLAAAALNS